MRLDERFRSRLTRLAATLSFRDNLGEVAKNAPPSRQSCLAETPFNAGLSGGSMGERGMGGIENKLCKVRMLVPKFPRTTVKHNNRCPCFSRQLMKVDWTPWKIRNVTWEIAYIIRYFVPDCPDRYGHYLTVRVSGWQPDFWSKLLEKSLVGERWGGGIHDLMDGRGNGTFQASLWGLGVGTTHCPPTLPHRIHQCT